jgi:hypothetical protein
VAVARTAAEHLRTAAADLRSGHPGPAKRTCGGGPGDGARQMWPAMRPPRRRCLDAPRLPSQPRRHPGPRRQDRAAQCGHLPGRARAADDGPGPASGAAEGRRDTPGIAGCRKFLTVKPRSNDLEPGYRIR